MTELILNFIANVIVVYWRIYLHSTFKVIYKNVFYFTCFVNIGRIFLMNHTIKYEITFFLDMKMIELHLKIKCKILLTLRNHYIKKSYNNYQIYNNL